MKVTSALCLAAALCASPGYSSVKDERPLYTARQLNKAILSDAGRDRAWNYIRAGVEALLYSNYSTSDCTAEQYRALSPYTVTENVARTFAELDEPPVENTPDGGLIFHGDRMIVAKMKDEWAMPIVIALVNYQCGLEKDRAAKEAQGK